MNPTGTTMPEVAPSTDLDVPIDPARSAEAVDRLLS